MIFVFCFGASFFAPRFWLRFRGGRSCGQVCDETTGEASQERCQGDLFRGLSLAWASTSLLGIVGPAEKAWEISRVGEI